MSVVPWGSLRDGIFEVLRDSLKDVFPDGNDLQQFKDLAEDIAMQKYLEANAKTIEERKRATENLAFLAADVQSRITIKQLRLGKTGKVIAIKTVVAVIKTIAMPALVVV